MTLSPQEQFLLDYLQSTYPTGLRWKAQEEDSLVYKYDVVRTNSLIAHINQRDVGVANLLVSTADSDWLTEWENYLHVPVDTSLSLEARRARLLVRLAGNPATIQNLRTVIEAFIGSDSIYEIVELWKLTPFDVDDTWTYMVDLYNPQPSWFINDMITILSSVHPAHCQLVIAYTYPVLDAIGLEDALDGALHQPFIWWEIGNPQPTDGTWSSDTTPLVWEYRS